MPRGDARWVSPETSDEDENPKYSGVSDFYRDRRFRASRRRFDRIIEDARQRVDLMETKNGRTEDVRKTLADKRKNLEELKKKAIREFNNPSARNSTRNPSRSTATRYSQRQFIGELRTPNNVRLQSKMSSRREPDGYKTKDEDKETQSPDQQRNSQTKESLISKLPGKIKSLIVNRVKSKNCPNFEELLRPKTSLQTCTEGSEYHSDAWTVCSSDVCSVCREENKPKCKKNPKKINTREEKKENRECRRRKKETIKNFRMEEKERRRREKERLFKKKCHDRLVDKEAKLCRLKSLKQEKEMERHRRCMFKIELRALKKRMLDEEMEVQSRSLNSGSSCEYNTIQGTQEVQCETSFASFLGLA